ncbi:hypothetical protein VTI74DRAFT_11664 [Chaetomium olivicolor]
MAVISLRWLVAGSACLPAVAAVAGLEREQAHPWDAMQTPGPKLDLKEAEVQVAPRAVTAHPAARGVLAKRATNTCGYKYLDGDSASAYVCANSRAQCLYNTVASAVGCCLTTDCNIYTACLPYISSNARSTLNMDRTRYCSDPAFPSCAALVYADPTGTLSGYTIPSCDTVATTYKFYQLSPGASSQKSSSTPRTTPARTTSSRTTSSGVSSADSSDDSDSSSTSSVDDESNTQMPAGTTTTSAPVPPPAGESSSTPVGPIVGGVVGGVAALGLIGLGIFFLVRRKNQKDAPPSPPANAAAAPVSGPGFMPPPGQGPSPNQSPPPNMSPTPGAPGAAAFAPHYTMMKPPMATTVSPMQGPPMTPVTVSPTGSPSPQTYHPSMQPGMGMANVPPAQGMGMGVGTPPPMTGMAPTPSPPPPQPYVPPNGLYQAYQPHHAVELPTQRGDGQVHELS